MAVERSMVGKGELEKLAMALERRLLVCKGELTSR
jgi:hypothetical protein